MSSSVVRSDFRSALQTAFPTVQYIETIASRVDNNSLESLWHTLEFIAEGDTAIALGTPTCRRETGFARVWIGAATGSGDAAISAHADAVIATFRGYTAPSDGIRVRDTSPLSLNAESDGRFIIGYTDLRYSRDYTA